MFITFPTILGKMKKQQNITISYNEFTSLNSLLKVDQKLLYKAIEAAKNAYAPYSDFKVGAAVQLMNGSIVIGSNQENAAYPSGLCAERVALFSASALHPEEEMHTLAIFAEKDLGYDEPVSPCGSCRQVMMEYELKQKRKLRVLLMGASGKVWEFDGVTSLLPFAFIFKP